MTRGFASGAIWGGVAALIGASALSLATPLTPPPEVGGATETVAEPKPVPDQPQTAPASDAAPAKTAEAAPGAPAPDSVAPVAGATDPSQPPVIGGATELARPEDPFETAAASVPATETPATTAPAAAPEAPSVSEAPASISTEPAQPSAPAVAETSGFAGGTAPAPETATTAEAASDTETVAGATPETPTDTPTETPTGTPAETAPENDVVAGTQDPPATPAEAETAPEPAPEPQPAPQIAALPQAGGTDDAATAPAIGTPVAPLTERAPGVSSRLPVAGASDDPEPDTAAVAPEAEPDLPPIRRHAAPFDNPEAKPLMSVVLIDDETSVGAEALAAFPYPLTFAVSPTDPDAAGKMARHRAAGFEVMALVDLDPAGTPQDAETVLAATFAKLPETVGVLEGVDSGIQGNRAQADQVTAILRDGGYGLITQPNGLDTVQKLALRDGVPAAVVFRDFDGAGQTPTVMRRFLDQAAFRAGQGDAVVMLGRVRPDTISALLLWGLQDRAAQVQLAPASAVLTSGLPDVE